MRYESAELCKIAINMCLVSSVTTANTIAELCEKIGASWSEIVPALKLDRRIGPHAYLAAGLGISGGNLERDLVTFCRLADEYGSDAEAVRAWIGNSGHRKAWPARAVAAALAAREASEPDAKIGVLGLAYKENTSSTKNTPAFTLLESLEGLEVVVYDPAVPAGAPLPHSTCVRVPDALAAAMGADIVALMTPWPEFRHLDPGQLSTRMRGRTIIDPYALLDARACLEHGLTVRTLGRGAPVAGRL
jgi:UDPglucose 6-dehydrogenase